MIIKVKYVALFTPGIYYQKTKNKTKALSMLMKGSDLKAVFLT